MSPEFSPEIGLSSEIGLWPCLLANTRLNFLSFYLFSLMTSPCEAHDQYLCTVVFPICSGPLAGSNTVLQCFLRLSVSPGTPDLFSSTLLYTPLHEKQCKNDPYHRLFCDGRHKYAGFSSPVWLWSTWTGRWPGNWSRVRPSTWLRNPDEKFGD
jgi:hypothetical protein